MAHITYHWPQRAPEMPRAESRHAAANRNHGVAYVAICFIPALRPGSLGASPPMINLGYETAHFRAMHQTPDSS